MNFLIQKVIINKDLFLKFTCMIFVLSNVSLFRNFALNTLLFFVVWGIGILIYDCYHKAITTETRIFAFFSFLYLIIIMIFRNVSLIDNLKSFVWLLFFFVVCFNLGFTLNKISHFFLILVYLITIMNIIALIMYVISFNSIEINLIGVVDGRLWGIFFDPNYGACINVIVFLISAFHFYIKRKNRYLFFCILSLFYIIFSASRGGLLTLTISLFVLVLLINFSIRGKQIKKRLKILAISLILPLSMFVIKITFPIMPNSINEIKEKIVLNNDDKMIDVEDNQVFIDDMENGNEHFSTNTQPKENKNDSINTSNNINERTDEEDSLNIRVSLIKEAFNLSLKYPILGVGDRNIKYYSSLNSESFPLLAEGKSIHNAYLTLLVSTGYIFTISLLSLIIFIGLKSIHSFIATKKIDMLLYILVCFSCLCAALTLTEVFFAQTLISLVFWVVLGYIVKVLKGDVLLNEK